MFDKDFEEFMKRKATIDRFADLAITLQSDPVERFKLSIARKCTDICTKLANIASTYSLGDDLNEAELNTVFSYLQLVEIGLDTFLSTLGDSHE